jgi:hypothetical protein
VHEFKVRKVQSEAAQRDQDDETSDRPTQFNVRNWTKERKPGVLRSFFIFFHFSILIFYFILFFFFFLLSSVHYFLLVFFF